MLESIKRAKKHARNIVAFPQTTPNLPSDRMVAGFRQYPRVWQKWLQVQPLVNQAQDAHRNYLQSGNQSSSGPQHAQVIPQPVQTAPQPVQPSGAPAQQFPIAQGPLQYSHVVQSGPATTQDTSQEHIPREMLKSRYAPSGGHIKLEPQPQQQSANQPLPQHQQHSTQATAQATPSDNKKPRPERLTVAEKARRGQSEPERKPPKESQVLFTPGPYDVHPDNRPGGKLPFPKVEFSRPLRECPDYPKRTDFPDRMNNLLARASLLSLAQDECQKICYGVYYITHGNKHSAVCPYILEPERCRNNHALEQGVIDFVVTQRGVTHATINKLIQSIMISGASGHVPPIKVPEAPSRIGPTPAQLNQLTGASQVYPPPVQNPVQNPAAVTTVTPQQQPVPVTTQTGAPTGSTPVAPQQQGRTAPKYPVTQGLWANARAAVEQIQADDAEKARLARENPVTHVPEMQETHRTGPGEQATTSTYASAPIKGATKDTSDTPSSQVQADTSNAAQDSNNQQQASGPAKPSANSSEASSGKPMKWGDEYSEDEG
jgi:hypothetical protein